MQLIIGIIAIFVSVALYFAGVRQGRRRERADREHESKMERERQAHERSLEQNRRRREIISKVADEYVSMARTGSDHGPHALARVGLENLASDQEIREAIEEMRVRAGSIRDPWAGAAKHVDDIDLLEFFRRVRSNGTNFLIEKVATVAQEVREAGLLRPKINSDVVRTSGVTAAEQIVGRERRGRVSQLDSSGDA